MSTRTNPPPAAGSIRVEDLEIFPIEGTVTFQGTSVHMTRREIQVLAMLAARPGGVVRREDIYAGVWTGRMPRRDRSVDVWVRKLRTKLRTIAPDHEFVHTHYGFGYRLWPERD
jgi:DNA-binding response OmpR family regulator